MVDEKEKAQSISETMTDGLLELDLHGKIIHANPAALSILGFSLQEITKKTHRDLTPAKWHQQESQCIQETNLAQHKDVALEQEYLRQNNSTFPVLLKPILLTGPDQQPAKILILFQDLTRQKEQEQLQQTNQRQLNSLSLITRKLQENDTVEQTVHFVLEALAAAMKYPEVAVPLIAIEDETFSTNKYSDELDYGLTASIFVHGREAGEVTVYYSENKPFILPDEQHILETVAQSLGVWLAQKSAAQELADIEEQHRSVFDSMADGFALYEVKDEGREMIVRDWNRAAEKMYNLLRHDVLGQDIKKFFPAMEKTDIYKAIMDCWKSGENKIIPLVHYHDNQRDQYMHNIIYRVGDKVAVIFRDVTEEEKTRQELLASTTRLNSIFNSIADPVFVKDDQFRFVFVNDALCSFLGLSREALIGKTGGEHLPPEQMEVFLAKDKGVLETGQENINEEKLTDSQGRVRDIVTKKTRFTDSAGKKFIVGVIRDITERKQMEEDLVSSNIILRTQQEASIDGMLVVDEKGKIISYNQRFISMWAIPPEIIESKSDERALQSVMDKLANAEEFIHKVKHLYEARYELSSDEIVLKDGRVFDRYSAPMIDAEGKYYGRVWYFRDITDRKQMEESLRRGESNYRLLAENTTDVIWTVDMNMKPTYMSSSVTRLLGYSVEEAMSRSMQEAYTPQSFALASKVFAEEIVRENADISRSRILELELNRKDGSTVTVETNFNFLLGPDGQPQGILAISRDITERKKMEINLRKQQEELRTILDSSPAMIFYKDKENNFIRVNQVMAKEANLTKEELEGKSLFDLYPREIADHYWQDDKAVMAAGQPKLNIVERMETTAGLKWVKTDKIPYKNEKGEIIGIIGFSFDITESKQAEEQVLKAAQEWAETFDSMADGVSIHSPDYTILNVNEVLCQILGKSRAEIIGRKCYEIFHGLNGPLSGCPLEKSKSTLKEEYAELFEPILNRWISATVSPILDETGKVVKIIHLIRDITDRKQAEELVRQSELQYRTLVNNLPGAVYRCVNDADWTMYYISAAIESLSGYPSADFIDNIVRSYNSIIYPDDRGLVNDIIQQQLKKKDSYSLEYRILHRDGTVHWVTEKGQGIYDDKGTLLWLDGAIFDITEHKRIEEELKKRMSELDRFNKVTMEREKRIIELKKKVKELEQGSHGQK